MSQCSSCGGICKKSGCERANVDEPIDYRKQYEVQKYAADNYRRLLDEGDHAYAEMELRYQLVLRVALDALSDLNNGLVVHEGHWHTRQHVAIVKIKECLK